MKKSVAFATSEEIFMLPEDNILFKGIDSDDCRRMISCFNADIRRYKSGSSIAGYDDYSDKIGIVLSGRAVMVRYDINTHGNSNILWLMNSKIPTPPRCNF